MSCPFSLSYSPVSIPKTSSGVGRRKSNLLFHNYSESTRFHNLKPPPEGGTEPYTDIELQEHYGNTFMKQFSNSISQELLKNIAFNLHDFLNSLESVHFYLFVDELAMQWIPEGMKCETRESNNTLLFHFCTSPVSHFTDPKNMVAGIIKELALFVFKIHVSVDMLPEVWEGKYDSIRHCTFSIKKITCEGQSPVSGLFPHKNSHKYYFPKEMLISPKTICKACPFHVIFNYRLNLVEIGSSLQRVLKLQVNEDGSVTKELHFTRIFNLKRPQLDDVSFDNFVKYHNAVVELQVKDSALADLRRKLSKREKLTKVEKRMRAQGDKEQITQKRCVVIRGQMIHIPESQSLLFIGMPPVRTLDDLESFGLYMSDIPVHDATREFILQNGALAGNITLERRMSKTRRDIKEAQKSLEENKISSYKLLCSMLPSPVVDTLLAKQMITPKPFPSVTIMLSDLTNFAELTADWEPRQMIDLLNQMYTEFDEHLADHNVYKVETVNDSYMVVGGCPEPYKHHAREVARMAIDMMDTMKYLEHEHPVTSKSLASQLRIGIHSGSIQAGVVGMERPRYCLFGDTVNVTSRTLTNGIPSKITITQYTYEILRDYENEFMFQDPRQVKMKGVDAPVMCYTLEQSKRRGSVDSNASRRSKTSVTVVPEWFAYPLDARGDSLNRIYLKGKIRSVSEGSTAAIGKNRSNLHHYRQASPLAMTPNQKETRHAKHSTALYNPLASKTSTSTASALRQSKVSNHQKSIESGTSRSNSVQSMPDGFLLTQPTNRGEVDRKRSKKQSLMITSTIAEEIEESGEATAAVAADCLISDVDGTDIDDYLPQGDDSLPVLHTPMAKETAV